MGPTNGRCQSLNQTVDLRSSCLERSQVIMPTLQRGYHGALLVIGGKILSGRTKDQNIHPQQGVGGAWLLDRQCNRDGWRVFDHAGDAR